MKKQLSSSRYKKIWMAVGVLLLMPFLAFAQEECSESNLNSVYWLIIKSMEEEKIAQEKMVKGDMTFQPHFEKMMAGWEEATETTFSANPCFRQKLLPKLKEIDPKTPTLNTFIQMLEIYQ